MQRALAQLVTRGALSGQGPMELAAQLPAGALTVDERRELGAIRADRVTAYARHVRAKRLDKVVTVFHWTFRLLDDRAPALLRTYCDERPPMTISKLEEGQRFFAFLTERTDLEPPYVYDVARYELSLVEFGRRWSRPPLVAHGERSKGGKVSTVKVPTLSSSALIVEFDYDLSTVLPALQAGGRPAHPVAGAASVLFCPDRDSAVPRALALGADLRALLRLCTGRKTLASVVDAFAAQQAADDAAERGALTRRCMKTLEQLEQMGVIVDRGPGGDRRRCESAW
jgi:hypothetical protein